MRTLRSVRLIPGILFLAVALTALACSSDESEPSAGTDGPTASDTATPDVTLSPTDDGIRSEDDPEYKLAAIDAGEQLDLNDPVIDEYTSLLDALESRCVEDRERIGGLAVRATELLADGGVTASVLDSLEGMVESLANSEEQGCFIAAAKWINSESGQ